MAFWAILMALGLLFYLLLGFRLYPEQRTTNYQPERGFIWQFLASAPVVVIVGVSLAHRKQRTGPSVSRLSRLTVIMRRRGQPASYRLALSHLGAELVCLWDNTAPVPGSPRRYSVSGSGKLAASSDRGTQTDFSALSLNAHLPMDCGILLPGLPHRRPYEMRLTMHEKQRRQALAPGDPSPP